jgi:hypothetical protein
MDNKRQPTFEELFPLPPGVKLHRRLFGATPPTPLKTVQPGGQRGAGEDEPPLTLAWDDAKLRLSAVVREDPTTGKLIGSAFCTDPAMLNKGAAAVSLVGNREYEMILKTIKLDQPDQRTGGCRGSADFGLLKDAVAKLGTEMGLVVFMVVAE